MILIYSACSIFLLHKKHWKTLKSAITCNQFVQRRKIEKNKRFFLLLLNSRKIKKNKKLIYPEEKLVNSQVSLISCIRCIRGRFQYGFGIREKAYGPANGGRVFVISRCAGPISVFLIVVTVLPCKISLSYGDCVVDGISAK